MRHSQKKTLTRSSGKRFSRLIKQIKKEYQLFWTDKFNFLIAIAVPPLVVLLLGFMMNSIPETPLSVRCVIVSYDSNLSTFGNFTQSQLDEYTIPYVEAVEKSEKLDLIKFYNATEEIYAMEEARRSLISGRIKVIISIPVDFSELISEGYPGLIECVPDSSDMDSIQDNLNAVYDSIKIFVNDNNLTPQFKITGFEEFSIPEGYNFRFNYNITLMLSFIVYGVALVLTILVVVHEKPVARLLLTPVKRYEILLSKYISYTLVLILQICLLLITTFASGLYLAGNLFDLFLALFMVGFSGLSMGIFISTISKTKTEANQLFFAFFLVIVLLSGIFIPIEAMPTFLQAIAYVLPLSHGDPMIKGIVTKGNSVFGFDFYSLLALSILFVIISFILFQRRHYEV
ncbi:MAG: ABC transporter permease [Candidatus Thorarchaeota archaeon]